jgi:hypothetical protein
MARPIGDLPNHHAVDWSTLESCPGGSTVVITCPWCGSARRDPAGQVKYRILKGTFTGYCYRDRLVSKQRRDRLPRLDHPAVDWDATKVISNGRQRLTRVCVTCPDCKASRWISPGPVAAKIREGKFTGRCLDCSPNQRKREWVTLSPGRKLDPMKGYIRLGLAAITAEDLALYDALRGARPFVLEHRFVMSKTLGRPLDRNELVDHIDGDKTNNDPENLRVYRRGHNDPGNTGGYGLFYDEWQRAEARIRKLEASPG